MPQPPNTDAAQACGDEPVTPPLHEAAAAAVATARRQLAELLELLTLEVRYSGLLLSRAATLAVVTALAAFSAWGLLMAAAAAWLLKSGTSWSTLLLALAAANGMVMFASLCLIRHALQRVGVDLTRQALGLDAE